jgi:hypothetical protein
MTINQKEKFLSELTEDQLFKLMKKRYSNLIDLNVKDKQSKIDWYDPDSNTWFEGKCRDVDLLSLFIKKDKWDVLKQKENAYYVNSTLSGIYMWNINEVQEPLWREQSMEQSQQFKSYGRIKKEVGDLYIKDAIQIDQLLLDQ